MRRPRLQLAALLVVVLGGGSTTDALAPDDPGPWRPVFQEDFAVDVATGRFGSSPYGSRWFAYPDGWPDTNRVGTYQPLRVVSVHDGVLDLWLRTTADGPASAALAPRLPTYGQEYGKYSVRFRSDAVPGFKMSFLLWPDSERWPQDGELNFPEGVLDGSINAFAHHADESGTQDVFSTGATFGSWHVATIEWLPGEVRFLLDGAVVGVSRQDVPTTSMHWVLQTETADGTTPDPRARGHVLVDWVAAWRYAG